MLVLLPRSVVVAAAVASVVAIVAAISPALADRSEPAPKQLDGVGLVQKLDAQLPLDLSFADEDGKAVRLADLFHPSRPVILTLNYYRCPMLCTLELTGLVNALKAVSLEPGRDYALVTLSIDPRETPALAKQKKATYVESLGRPGAEAGWRFLTGREDAISALSAAVGFEYKYDPEQQQYAHPAAIFLVTPEGKISRVLSGVEFDPKTVRLALVEASRGRIGTPVDQFVLFCFHYDAEQGKYAPAAMRLMQLGGGLSALLLAAALSLLWIREKRRRRAT